MIFIKRTFILSIIIISIILLAFFSTPKKQKPLNKIIEDERMSEIDSDGEPLDEELETAMMKEDPVRDFISDQLKRATNFFFTNEINVVAIGDSLTEGVGDDTENGGYVGVLDETINEEKQLVHFDNFGKRGNRSGQLIERLEEREIKKAIEKSHIVLITIGANDIMQVFKDNFTDLSLDQFTSEQIKYEQRLETIFDTIKNLNEDTEIYLIGFYNPFKRYFSDIEELDYIVESWNTIGADVANRYEKGYFIPMVDIFDEAENEFYLSGDNFHPNHTGYEMMAERILQFVIHEGERNNE